MSSDAVTRRLRRSSDLRDLCVALMKAKKSSDEKAAADGSNVGEVKVAEPDRANLD